MRIGGLQKLTLLDFPGRVASTVFLCGCNLRCPFCHNASLILPERFPEGVEEKELLDFLQKRAGVLDGVCITGGEPLLYEEALGLMEKIKGLGYLVKLDTNGFFPKRLRLAVEKGLVDYVAMDYKHTQRGYPEATGLGKVDMDAVNKSIDFLLKGSCDYELRTTVVKPLHMVQDLKQMAKRLQGAKRYFLQQFVASDDVIQAGFEAYSPQEMQEMLTIVKQYVPAAQLRGV